MGFFEGLARGLNRANDREILQMVNDEDDEILSGDYRKTAIQNTDSNNGWYKCIKCGKSYRLNSMDADHIVPKSKGGDNSRHNLQLICYHCNRIKNNKTDETMNDLVRRKRELRNQDNEDLAFLQNIKKYKKGE